MKIINLTTNVGTWPYPIQQFFYNLKCTATPEAVNSTAKQLGLNASIRYIDIPGSSVVTHLELTIDDDLYTQLWLKYA